PRLGRGLKSLISNPIGVISPSPSQQTTSHPAPANGHAVASPIPPAHSGKERLAEIDLDMIDPNPHQPRAAIDPLTLKELAASIKHSGILQPIILRPVNGRYQLVAGHRRTQAAKIAGLTRVPALLRHDSTDAQQAEWALIENIQRQDLNPIERSKAYRSYVDNFKVTHAQAADRLGEDRATISNFLRLLDLNAGIQDLIARGLLSAGHAKVLAGITDKARQDALANRAVADGLSVRKLEELAGAPDLIAEDKSTAVSSHTRTLTAKSPHVVELEQELSRKLGTKLRIFPSKKKNTGKIVIQYYSLDEFDRIVEKFQ
ncbi:MAG TPA: ParB/RepB/Spo0J family partition protein, partial [Phycisphaerae bacterium]